MSEMINSKLHVVVLAAGKGTRMQSDKPKVIHKLAGEPMLGHVLKTARELNPVKLTVVCGHGAEELKTVFSGSEDIHWVLQKEQLGTGHAVKQVLADLDRESNVLILYGDVPLISAYTLGNLVEVLDSSDRDELALLTVNLDDPKGYGRIVRGATGSVLKIVEEKDASESIRQIKEVNTGIMLVKAEALQRWIPKLTNSNQQNEFYLTDIVGMAVQDGQEVEAIQPSQAYEVDGVNNRIQLSRLERIYQKNQADQLMAKGLAMADPSRFDLRGSLEVGKDCFVDINAVVEGNVRLGDRVMVGPNCIIRNSEIGSDTRIEANSIIEDSRIETACTIGPFARVRPGSLLEQGAKVGNFVEIKKAHVGKNSKINHLSYVGDAELGEDVNVGAGTITCNYDGVNKHKTQIGHRVFVGSNTALVAPVSVGDDATIGAGSVVTREVGDGELAVARSKQRNISGWDRPTKNKD